MRWLFFILIIIILNIGIDPFRPNACFCEEVQDLIGHEEEFIYNSANKRNPFMPLVTKDGRYLFASLDITEATKGVGDIILEGILKDFKDEYLAIINGDMVKVGSRIKGFDVVEIRENMVKLSKDGNEKIYKLTE